MEFIGAEKCVVQADKRNIAHSEKLADASGRFRQRFRTPHGRIQRHCRRQRVLADQRDSQESAQVPGYTMESGPTSVESLMEPTDAANSSAPSSSANSSVSNISMEPVTLVKSLNSAKTLFKKKSLVQLINSYIKAGIEEGKRQAKKYIRKALSFGVRSGYLIPTDPQGNVLRVCSALVPEPCTEFSRKTDAESRRKRRIARRGEATRLTTVDDRKAMRRGILRDKSHQDVDNEQTSRNRKEEHRVPATGSQSPQRLPQRPMLRAKNKSKSETRKKRIDNPVETKRRQQRKRSDRKDMRKPIKRRRVVLSPVRVDNYHEKPVAESYQNASNRDRDQYKSDEEDYRAVVEMLNSTSSQEKGSRVEKGTVETNIEDDHDETKRGNIDDDDDEKSEEASVECDASNVIREKDA